MSLLIAWCAPDRALVAVDTLGLLGRLDGPSSPVSKMVTFAHASAVLAARGDGWVLNMVWLLLAMQTPRDFDAIEGAMPGALQHISKLLPSRAQEIGMTLADLERQELVLVGWSEQRGRMVATSFTQANCAEGFKPEPITEDDDYIAPWDDEAMGEPPVPSTLDAICEIARAQIGRWPIGGRLVVARLSNGSVSISDEGSIEQAQGIVVRR